VGSPQFLHLQAERGTLVIVPGPGDVLAVALGGPGMNLGLARLEMLRAIEVTT